MTEPTLAHSSDGRPGCSALLSELLVDPLFNKPIQWDLYPITGKGLITLIVALPKVGKSTFLAHLVHAKASGGAFLGTELTPEPVLVVSPDEAMQLVMSRFQELDTPPDMVRIWTDRAPSMPTIAAEVSATGVGLVVIDTLSRVAAGEVENENDNAAWTRFFNEHDPAIRESDAVWVFTHHARKRPGQYGGAIRGAGTIFSSVDVAISLWRYPKLVRARIVELEGTRFEQFEKFVIQLSEAEDEYLRIGSETDTKQHADPKVADLIAQVRLESSTVNNIAIRAGVKRGTAYAKLGLAAAQGLIEPVAGSRGLEYRSLSAVHPNKGCGQLDNR